MRKAFTLIELIVAIAIFSLIAMISYSLLNTSFKNKEVQDRHSMELFKLQNTLNFLERDISQTSNQQLILDDRLLTLFSFQNDDLLKIQYSLTSNQLIRKDITDLSEPVILELLDQVNAASIRVLDNQNQWKIEWSQNENNYIRAIEIKFKHPFWGDLTKLILVDD